MILKHFTARHELPDGSSYEIPYSNKAGPTGDVFGLGDLRLSGGLAGRAGATPLLLSASLGATLPTGRTSPNPFDPQIPASQRQHRQFGNGTVDPIAGAALSLGTEPFGLLVTGGVRVPLYANPRGYRGQFLLSGSAGVVVRPAAPAEGLRLLLLADATHAGAATWDGEPAQNSGGDTVGLRLGFEWAITHRLSIRGSLRVVPIERWIGDQFSQPVSGSLGVSGLVDLPKAKKRTSSE